ncbi:alpha/beta hydrolase [Rugosimonospora acidiphila]|uniref:Alpha/beta hydrolase n=1 Tax=Rugosimonospora acidiphila TaxID=556531 RepID=A0ABP9RQK9_9ACTN
MISVPTPHGEARVVLDVPDRPASLLVLGHGAGGDVDAPDLVAVRDACLSASVAVARVLQPYRVAGRRAPAPARQLDAAWTAVVETLRSTVPSAGTSRRGAGRSGGTRRRGDLPLIVGGRSSGARVACRTAAATGAAGIVALAFPLHPPGRPERSRAEELDTGLPTVVVNGDRDPFGVPEAGPLVEVCLRPGERHDLRRDPAAVADCVVRWLVRHGWA